MREAQENNAVIVAEGAFTFNTMKHHSSYKTADFPSVLFKTIFPDSEIVHKFSRVQTKTEAFINSVIAHHAIENIKQVFKNNSLTIGLQSQCCEVVPCCNSVF
jgi:hypothetical protein